MSTLTLTPGRGREAEEEAILGTLTGWVVKRLELPGCLPLTVDCFRRLAGVCPKRCTLKAMWLAAFLNESHSWRSGDGKLVVAHCLP